MKDLDYEKVIDGYNDLRETCLVIAKLNDELMGPDRWLKFAIQDSDITLMFTERGIVCYGSAYTTQTMDNEHFSFMIPFEYLEEFEANAGAGD
ncbi:hypothetical protein SEA_PHREDRICK_152 [Streptomyces phage Phredrick]|nr:hypothetical protein SEA_PHREDRICK_152 [Streptomyces phage Phredrick]